MRRKAPLIVLREGFCFDFGGRVFLFPGGVSSSWRADLEFRNCLVRGVIEHNVGPWRSWLWGYARFARTCAEWDVPIPKRAPAASNEEKQRQTDVAYRKRFQRKSVQPRLSPNCRSGPRANLGRAVRPAPHGTCCDRRRPRA